MQKHYGQDLSAGAFLDDAFTGTNWCLIRSESVVLEKSARDMAQLHVANLRTWGGNDFAVQAFDRCDGQINSKVNWVRLHLEAKKKRVWSTTPQNAS